MVRARLAENVQSLRGKREDIYTSWMPRSVRPIVSRVVLFVMLLTFLSPNLGWQMTASHDELQHALVHDPDHGDDDHHEAHGLVGHLLTHMPMSISAIFSVPLVAARNTPLDAGQFTFSPGVRDALFRPPQFHHFV